jgi:ring-1,2-phenylacetyl-CoA epoxidase subunit PaaD
MMVTDDRLAAAWQVLDGVLDPEVPAVSVRDLGIVRDVRERSAEAGGGLEVVLTPTYSGCPATEAIEASVVAALVEAGLGPVAVTLQRSPAWTTDWITEEGRRRLRDYGIAPPTGRVADGAQPIQLVGRAAARFDAAVRRAPAVVACPRCGDANTERLSAYGSTACKALYRCLACREPFEYFKPL